MAVAESVPLLGLEGSRTSPVLPGERTTSAFELDLPGLRVCSLPLLPHVDRNKVALTGGRMAVTGELILVLELRSMLVLVP